jgi:hypothetical protein
MKNQKRMKRRRRSVKYGVAMKSVIGAIWLVAKSGALACSRRNEAKINK